MKNLIDSNDLQKKIQMSLLKNERDCERKTSNMVCKAQKGGLGGKQGKKRTNNRNNNNVESIEAGNV